MTFDTIIAVDWSARSAPSTTRPQKDALFACVCRAGRSGHPQYFRTRAAVMDWLEDLVEDELAAGRRVLVGFDFAFGYPAGFAAALTGSASALAVWDWLSERIEDAPDNANNRFDVAAQMNAALPGVGPFWGCPASQSYPGLPHGARARRDHGMTEFRRCEVASGAGQAQARARRAQPVWKLYTTGAVGSQSLLGQARLNRLRRRLGVRCAVWPLERGPGTPEAPVCLVEIYPSVVRMNYLIPLQVCYPDKLYHIIDAEQVRAACDAYGSLWAEDIERMFGPSGNWPPETREEGWILGIAPPRKDAA